MIHKCRKTANYAGITDPVQLFMGINSKNINLYQCVPTSGTGKFLILELDCD